MQVGRLGRRRYHTRAMNSECVKELLAGLPLTETDAVRLVLETVEDMNLRAAWVRVYLLQALRRVMRAGIVALQAQEKTVTFAQAVQESLERRADAGRRPTTLRDLRSFTRRLLKVPGFAERPMRGIEPGECRDALEYAFSGSAHSFRKGRAILHSIFAYAIRQQWCSSNPVDSVEVPLVDEKEIVPLTLEECRRLVETAKTPRFRDCLPALGLMLFAGVRPGEVERLQWADVHCEEGVLTIASRHSKTGGARRVELCPALRRMLRQHSPRLPEHRQQLLCPPHWQKRWQLLRQAAGLVTAQQPWVPDVLRHTFASYHALTHHNLPALQLQLGHRDSRLLLSRYLNLRPLRRREAKPFWELVK